MAGADSIPRPSGRAGLVQTGGRQVGRQIKLPWSKAIEISVKSVKVRFWRSFITAAGIVLAIAFLMATLTRNSVIGSLKVEVPAQIAELRGKLSAAMLQGLQEKAVAAAAAAKRADEAEAAAKAAEPKDESKTAEAKATRAALLERVRDALKNSEFQRGANLLEKALNERPTLGKMPEVQALQQELTPVLAILKDLNAMDETRLALIKQGETPLQPGEKQQDRGGAGAREAHVRDYWLMTMALLVAFVGITNAMLMSVTERFREIGTMKCLGALDSFVVKLFLIESSMQGFLGTLCGVVLGLLLALLKVYTDYGGSVFGFMPWAELGLAFILALVCGTVLAVGGALYPAYVAAKMEPAVAMRVDQ
jgi:hypothetical protein